MSRTEKVTGISVKNHSLGEYDRIITFFTREHGLVRAVAKGVKKGNSRWSGRLDTLFCNELTLAKGRSLDVIVQADTVYAFPRLRRDLDRLAHGLYLLELALVFSTEEDPHASDLFDLLMGTLQALEEFSPVALLIHWFELRLLHLLGYTPRVEACLYCSEPLERTEPGSRRFDIIGGGYVCTSCTPLARQLTKMPVAGFDLWQHLLRRSVSDLVAMAPSDKLLGISQHVLRTYIAHTAEKSLKTLATLKSLQIAAS